MRSPGAHGVRRLHAVQQRQRAQIDIVALRDVAQRFAARDDVKARRRQLQSLSGRERERRLETILVDQRAQRNLVARRRCRRAIYCPRTRCCAASARDRRAAHLGLQRTRRQRRALAAAQSGAGAVRVLILPGAAAIGEGARARGRRRSRLPP